MTGIRWPSAIVAIAVACSASTRAAPSAASERGPAVVEYGELLDEQATLLEQLDALDDALDDAREAVELAGERRTQLVVQLVENTVALARARRRLRDQRARLGKRLRALLTAERTRRLALWLDVAAVASNDRRLRLLEALARDDRARIRQYVAAVRALRAARKRLDDERRLLVQAEREARERQTRLDALAARRKAMLERIESDRVTFEAAHQELAAVYAELADRIRRLETWREGPVPLDRLRGRLRLPMSYARVVTRFGRHEHPALGVTTFQPGIEIASNGSDSVRVVHWGRVAFVGPIRGLGLTVVVDHGNGYHTVYAHLAKVLVEPGQVVESRQVLGTIGGHTGIGTPNTLYFELRAAGRPVDPLRWFVQP